MFEVKQNQSLRLPVRLLDSSGNPVTGKVHSEVTATVEKGDGATATLTLVASDWTEVTAGAFSGAGKYTLVIPTTATNVLGPFCVAVAVSGAEKYIAVIKVVANEEADTKAVVDGIRTDYTTARAANLDNLDAAISTRATSADVLKLIKYQEGKWQIHATGADANRLVIYDTDGTTPLKKFDLRDVAGDPTFINPFLRNPLP